MQLPLLRPKTALYASAYMPTGTAIALPRQVLLVLAYLWSFRSDDLLWQSKSLMGCLGDNAGIREPLADISPALCATLPSDLRLCRFALAVSGL